jgi:hypothetical protein
MYFATMVIVGAEVDEAEGSTPLLNAVKPLVQHLDAAADVIVEEGTAQAGM